MDNVWLTGPLGTQWNIGSWYAKDLGQIDYGARDVLRQQISQGNPYSVGARTAYDTISGARTMTFPLRVPSGGIAGLSLDAIEGSLRQMVLSGGFVDLKPDGVPSVEMVRFDVLGGGVAHGRYSVDLQRIDRRELTLTLQTQPFGYWATQIIAASVASWGLIAPLPLTTPIVGDLPAAARVVVQPTIATMYAPNGTTIPDVLVWGFAGKASFLPWLGAASWIQTSDATTITGTPTLIASAFHMPSFNVLRGIVTPAQGATMLGQWADYCLTPPLVPAYAGRYRACFAGAHDMNGHLGIDVTPLPNNSFASAAPTPSVAAYYTGAAGAIASGGVGVYDLGEVTVPSIAATVQLRLWVRADASYAPTNIAQLAGVWLAPVAGGVVARGGMHLTQYGQASAYRFAVDSINQTVAGELPQSDLATSVPVRDLRAQYFGQMPYLSASTVALCALTVDRIATTQTASIPPGFSGGQRRAAVSVTYQPRFTFLKGI